ERDHVRRYLARSGDDIAWDMIRLAHMTVSVMAIIPMQDLMDLGNEARMNYPGRLGGNWQWRSTEPMLTDVSGYRLAGLTELYGREIVDEDPEPAYRIEVEEPWDYGFSGAEEHSRTDDATGQPIFGGEAAARRPDCRHEARLPGHRLWDRICRAPGTMGQRAGSERRGHRHPPPRLRAGAGAAGRAGHERPGGDRLPECG